MRAATPAPTPILALPLALALALTTLAGCGYHLVGTSASLPEGATTLHVKTFANKTRWTDVDQRLTEAVVREWVRRRRLTLVDEEKDADLVMEGTVVSLNSTPVTLDEQGRATEYQMTLTVDVRLIDRRGDKPTLVWRDKAFSRRWSYAVDVNAVDYFDRQMEAMELLSEQLARDLVTAVLEGF